jgi:hypothetical protein
VSGDDARREARGHREQATTAALAPILTPEPQAAAG